MTIIDKIKSGWKEITKIQKYVALFSNLIILSTSFLLLILLKYRNGNLVYFFINVSLCLLMWFFLIYMKVVHPNFRHGTKEVRDDSYGIIAWITATQLLFIIPSQVLLGLK